MASSGGRDAEWWRCDGNLDVLVGETEVFFFFGVKFLGEFLGRIVVGEGEMRV